MSQVARIEKIDITPDKSIYHKIGEANYSISDALAELVDNAIDAANDNGVEVLIILDKHAGKITVQDNGRGMDKEAAKKCLVLAHSKKHEELGEFGLGMKSACTSLGTHFSVHTKQRGSPEAYVLEYDRDKFINQEDWKDYPMTIVPAPAGDQGTSIEITSLKIKLYDALVTRVKDDLARRYGPYILHNNVIIRVGLRGNTAKPCNPVEPALIDGSKKTFEYRLPGGESINGWYALLAVGSQKESGFNIFRRGRLIRASEKLGYNYHPTLMRITGDINLDPVPVTHNKREFILESGEFRDFIENFWGDLTEKYLGYRAEGLIDEITKLARNRENEEKASDAMPAERKETIKNKMLEALNRLDEFKELAFPELRQEKRSERGIVAPKEKRDHALRIASEEPTPDVGRDQQKRVPKKTQQSTAKFIMVNGRKFKFEFYLKNLGNDVVDRETIITPTQIIEIYINTGFKGYSLTRDTNFYSTFHVAEAIADIYVKEAKQRVERTFELRNNLLHEVASVILEEEDLKKLERQEKELQTVVEKRKELQAKKESASLI